MANNPFYPGYISDKPIDGSASPFYPGYYAGKPISRRPQSKNFLKPLGEYNVDEFFGEVDRLGTTTVTGVPTYIKDRLVDDFQQALKATYRPPDVDVTNLDDYDPDVLPGVASVSLSLNPKDWINPKEQLQKTAKDWIKATTGVQFAKKGWGITGMDLGDYENRVNTKMWAVVMGIHNDELFDTEGRTFDENGDVSDVDYKKGKFSPLMVEGKKAIEGRTLAGSGYTPPNPLAPLSFSTLGGGIASTPEVYVDNKTGEVKVKRDYDGVTVNALLNTENGGNFAKDVASNIVGFEQNARSGLRRDTAYDKFLLSSLQLAHNELNRGYRPEILGRIKDVSGETAANNAETALDILQLRSTIHTELTGLNNALTGPAGTTTRMQKMIAGAVDAGELGILRETTQQRKSTFVDANGYTYDSELGRRFIMLRQRTNELLGETDAAGNVVKKGKIDEWIAKAESLDPAIGSKMKKELEQMKIYTQGIHEQISFAQIEDKATTFAGILSRERGTAVTKDEASSLMDLIKDKKDKTLSKDERSRLQGVLDQIDYDNNTRIGRMFSGRKVEGSGYDAKVVGVMHGQIDERALSRSLRGVRDGKGRPLTGGTMFEGSVERSLLMQFESDMLMPGSTRGIDAGHQIGSVLRRNEVQYLNLYSNKARVVAGRLNVERISYQMDEFNTSMQQGKIIENYVWKPLVTRFTGYTPAELTTEFLKKRHYFGTLIDDDYVTAGQAKSKLFNAMFQHKVNISIDGTNFALNGGKHFTGLLDLNGIRFTQGALLSGEAAKLTGKAAQEETKRRILMLLTGEASLTEGEGKNWKIYGFMGGIGREDLQSRIEKLKAWLNSAENKTGIKAIKGNEDRLWSLFEALRKENSRPNSLKITKKYAGLMDRVGPTLNRIQTRIFNSAIFQKLVKPVLQLKTIIQERVVQFISAALAKLINGAITAATGGIGVVLTPIIEKILKPIVGFLVRKTTAYIQTFMSGLLHGDWQAMMKQWDKEVANTVKWALIVTGFPVIIMMLVILGIMGAFSTTVSPIDPTKNAAGYGAANQSGGIIPPNENAYMKVTKDVEVTTSAGTSTNPGPPVPNEELTKAGGVRAHYIITVTAKQAIPAGVSWYDFTTQSQQSVGGKALYQTGPNALPAMTQGQSITLSIDDQSFHAGDEDSIISNTIMLDFSQAAGLQDVDSISFTRQFGIGNVVSEVPNCEGLPAGVLPPQVSSPGPGGQIAARAYQIASGLQRGFWCNFNHSMEYPELWNQGRFEADPFPTYPGDIQNEPNSLFWCTWMTAKSYTSVWGKIPNNQLDPLSLTDNGFPDVAGSWFQIATVQQNSNYLWMPRASTPISQIQPGDIIFFNKGGRLAHVGIVYSKTTQSITTIESNNFVLSVTIPTESCGSGDCPVAPVVPTDTDMEIYGFGRHK